MKNILDFLVLTVDFASEIFNGSESLGFVEIVVAISGGSPTLPVNLIVNTIGQTANGENYINNMPCVGFQGSTQSGGLTWTKFNVS